MTDLETSLADSEFIDEVRNSLAGLDASKIPDDTIIQTKDRVVEPLLNDLKDFQTDEQDAFDNASIMWSAEFSYDAWMTFSRLRDREVEAYVDPKGYKEQLKVRTNQVLSVLGVTRPSDIPQTVVSIQHDGVKRSVDLSQVWKEDTVGSEGAG